jgi:methionyl-tRNA synthetase
MPRLDVSNDFFIRTSDPSTWRGAGGAAARVRQRARLQGTYEGWYCPRCADFKVENEIEEGNRCPIHHIELDARAGGQLLLPPLHLPGAARALYAERPDFVRRAPATTRRWRSSRGGLQDVSLTRAKLTWGVPVPVGRGHVFYVWFDALLNYYTALGYARAGEDLTDALLAGDYHLIGKDILKFHTVFWPALLMAAGLPLPEHIFVHGYLLMDGEKMSKSLGNVLDPFEVMDRFGTDALRYYCLRDVSFGQDGVGVHRRVRGALRDRAGQRAGQPGQPHDRDAPALPRRRGPVRTAGPGAGRDFDGLAERGRRLIDRAEITAALDAAWRPVRRLNRYVEEQAPWNLAKDADRRRTSTASCAPWPRACASRWWSSRRGCRRPPAAAGRAGHGRPLAGGRRLGAGSLERGRAPRAAVPQRGPTAA